MRRQRERTPRLKKKGNGQTRPVALTFLGGHLVDPSPHTQLERPEKRHHGGIRQRPEMERLLQTKEKQQRRQIYSNSENSDDQIKKGGGL